MPRMRVADALRLAREHLRAGRYTELVTVCQALLAANPQEGDAYGLLALVAAAGAQPERAMQFALQGIACAEATGECFATCSRLLKNAGQIGEAEAVALQGIARDPGSAPAHEALGTALHARGQWRNAEEAYRQALVLDPNLVEAWANLAVVLADEVRMAEAATAARRAVELEPRFVEAWNTLGNALHHLLRMDEAEVALRQALALRPDYAEAESNLASTLMAEGRAEEAGHHYWHAVESRPQLTGVLSNALSCEQYRPGVTAADLAARHAIFEERFGLPRRAAWRPHPNPRDQRRPLRLGFVSNDFGQHPVGYFLVRVLENLDRQQFTSLCYSGRAVPDALSRRIQAASTDWRDISGWDPDRLPQQVRADGIDILFDLAGHTALWLPAFAFKPAPLQITWIGYVGTTGLSAIDYLLADRWQVPSGEEAFYVEKVLRMPDGYVCYDPPVDAPLVGPLAARQTGRITFGCFNRLAKINEEVVTLWSKILERVPSSHLVIKFHGLEQESTRQGYRQLFAARGIDPSRIDLRPSSPHPELLSQYNEIDIGLDPFPYSGGLMTCEALWMGVPVITCPGKTFAGRHATSHVSNVGLRELVAGDHADYVERAVALAGDWDRLASLRSRLRDQMATSPLCDGPRFARHFGAILREVWIKHEPRDSA